MEYGQYGVMGASSSKLYFNSDICEMALLCTKTYKYAHIFDLQLPYPSSVHKVGHTMTSKQKILSTPLPHRLHFHFRALFFDANSN